MAIVKNFDLRHLYADAKSYMEDMRAFDIINDEIANLYQEIRYKMVEGDPTSSQIEEKMQLYLSLIKRRNELQHAISQAEKNLEQSIDLLSSLGQVQLPDGNSIRVVKRDSYLHAQVYVVDRGGKVRDSMILEMASNPSEIQRIQKVIDELHDHLMQRVREETYDADVMAEKLQQDVENVGLAREKIDLFGKFRHMMTALNERLPQYIGKAKDMIAVVRDVTKSNFQRLKAHVNDWGQYLWGEYRSVQKSFVPLEKLEHILKDGQKKLDEIDKQADRLVDKMGQLKFWKMRLSNRYLGMIVPSQLNASIDDKMLQLSEKYNELMRKKEEIEGHLAFNHNIHVRKFMKEMLDLPNRTIGPYSFHFKIDNDVINISISHHTKTIQHIRLPFFDNRPLPQQIAELERLNSIVRSLRPRSINDRSADQTVDPELNDYIEKRKSSHLYNISSIVHEFKNMNATTDEAYVREKVERLIEAMREYSNYSNEIGNISIDKDGMLRVDFCDREGTKLTGLMSVQLDPDLCRTIMDHAHSLSAVNEKVYAVDQSQEFNLTMDLYMKQYEEKATRHIQNNDIDGLARINKALVDRIVSLNQMVIGNAVATFSRHGDGFKIQVVDANGNGQVIVCPLGLDGKIEFSHLRDYMQYVVTRQRENKGHESRRKDHEMDTRQHSSHTREQDVKGYSKSTQNIYDLFNHGSKRPDGRDHEADVEQEVGREAKIPFP